MGDYFCNRAMYKHSKVLDIMAMDLTGYERYCQLAILSKQYPYPQESETLKLYNAMQIYEELGKRGFEGVMVSSIDWDRMQDKHPNYPFMLSLLEDIKETHPDVKKTMLQDSYFKTVGEGIEQEALNVVPSWIGEIDLLINFIKKHGAIYSDK